jgi:hypothetical protein
VTRPLRASGNRYLAKIMEQLPHHHREALAIAAQAQQKLTELTPVADVPPELDPLATGNISDDWIDAQLNHFDQRKRLERLRNLLVDLKQRAEGHATAVLEASTDFILTALHEELTEVLNNAGQVAGQLDGVANAEQAIAADLGPAWKRLSVLADDYDQLRAAQQTVMLRNAFEYFRSAQPADGGEDIASDLHLRNLDQIWPSWRTPGQGIERVIKIDGTAHRYEPWPPDKTEQLLWLVTSNAEPWIPTTTQLDELWRRRRQRMNPNPKPLGTQRELINKTPTHRVVEPIKHIQFHEEDNIHA